MNSVARRVRPAPDENLSAARQYQRAAPVVLPLPPRPAEIPTSGLLPLDHLLAVATGGPIFPGRAPTFPARFQGPESSPGGARRFSLLTYNVWGIPPLAGYGSSDPHRFETIGDRLAATGHDVVCLQEVWDARSLVILARAGRRFPYVSEGAPCRGSLGRLFRTTGLVTLSAHPVVRSETLVFSSTSGIERCVKKGMLWTRIRLPGGRELDVYNCHLASKPESLNTYCVSEEECVRVRGAQVAEAAEWVARRRESGIPVIVAGDCNCEEDSAERRALEAAFGHDLYRTRHPAVHGTPAEREERAGVTYDTGGANIYAAFREEPSERLDYVFLGRGPRPSVAAAREFTSEPLSDHYAVSVTLAGNL